jgi:hypothetical protein
MNIPSNAKCPKCEATITRAIAGHVSVEVPMGDGWNGIAYSCPACRTLLSVQIDPVALKSDIVDELFERLRK